MSAGKGDSPRQVDPKKYGDNYDRIFRKVKVTMRELKDASGKVVAHAEYHERIKP